MEPILSVRELTKTFSRPGQGKLTAVNGVSFDLRPGERLGIIGESGSGKTTVANLVTRLLDADGGRILLDGEDITSVTGRDLRRVYRKIQMVFQTPLPVSTAKTDYAQIMRDVAAYRGIPIFRNDWVAVTNTPADVGPPAVPESNTADIYAGVWDDGSKKIGLSGITSENQMGIFVSNVGEKEDTNDVVTRLRFYCGLALYSELGIAMAPEVDDAVLP